MTPSPVRPDYDGACLSSVLPMLFGRRSGVPTWAPAMLSDAEQVVLFVIDGLGWEQLREHERDAPTLASMIGGPITSVAPSTTSAALTSIALGAPPGQHGVVGYRMHVGESKVLNLLRWRTQEGDAAELITPDEVQPGVAFAGRPVPVVTRAHFEGSAFTTTHLRGARFVGWRQPSQIAVEVGSLLEQGEELVYAYYDGVDRAAHDHGLGNRYAAELRWADRIVADLMSVLPPGATLVVTADHGQVDVGDAIRVLDDVADDVVLMSGEGRFRWLHTRAGTQQRVAERVEALFGHEAWVRTRGEIVADGWFGELSQVAAARLGDVAVVPFAPVAFADPAEPGENSLRARHGSLTSAEMLVPLVAASV